MSGMNSPYPCPVSGTSSPDDFTGRVHRIGVRGEWHEFTVSVSGEWDEFTVSVSGEKDEFAVSVSGT